MHRRCRSIMLLLTLLAMLVTAAPRAGAEPPTLRQPATQAPDSDPPEQAPAPEPPDLTPMVQEIFKRRAQWLLPGTTPPPLEEDYDLGRRAAGWALRHEQAKLEHVKAWAANRNVQFVVAEPHLRIRTLQAGPDRAKFAVTESLELGYIYPGEPTINRFGVGSHHVLELRLKEDRWKISKEWYRDPLGEEHEVPAGVESDGEPAAPVAARGYNRVKAVAYADKYCGVAWGCGNNHRYHPRRPNYNAIGGDCANFVTQVIRDGGGVYVPPIPKARDLAHYLARSGRASLVARGRFPRLWKLASSRPVGFQSFVGPGDAVAFQDRGGITHFAVITAFDTHGYPLVNSHNLDRYHTPFDLGWDKKIIYWFFRVHG